jgi:hypothetical protein
MDEQAPAIIPNVLCRCASLADLAVVPMGMDGLDEAVFSTLETTVSHDGDAWWLFSATCRTCGQNWMVAADTRIYDDYFMKRIGTQEAHEIVAGHWPADFITYERVLRIGRTLSKPCEFADPFDNSLVWTAEDLRKERPDISSSEIAYLLGITPSEVAALDKARLP